MSRGHDCSHYRVRLQRKGKNEKSTVLLALYKTRPTNVKEGRSHGRRKDLFQGEALEHFSGSFSKGGQKQQKPFLLIF